MGECKWNETTFNWNTTEYTWDSADCENPLGCVWNTNPFDWDLIEYIWNSAELCFTPTPEPSADIGGGVDLTQLDHLYGDTKDKDKDEEYKKKLIKVIVYLNHRRYVAEKEVYAEEKYKITVEDINMLLKEYDEYKKKILISIDNVKWN